MKITRALPVIAALLSATVPSCAAGKKLPPCASPNVRTWCRCEIEQTTKARAAAGLPAACSTPFVATKCVDKDAMGGFREFLSGLDKIRELFSTRGLPYVTVGENAFWVLCPKKDGDGNSDCASDQPGNPWPSFPVADLDSSAPLAPGLRPQGGPGGSGSDTGPTEGGGCSLCLADAPCDGLTPQECTTMHCAAVCPWDDVPAATCQDPGIGLPTGPTCAVDGASCGVGATCCAPLICYASDVGAMCK